MRVAILGLGVIGTTYAYAFQKAGHETFHIIKKRKKDIPSVISVQLLDGRYNAKGEEKQDKYKVSIAENNEEYDFIIVSVASGKLDAAIRTIKERNIKGTIVLFCNFWNERSDIERIIAGFDYITAFPTAGGHMNDDGSLNCALFDHIMLENREKANIANYSDLESLLNSSDIKQEIPHDMFEWIWIHMAINAGVTSTAGRNGKIDNPNQLARELMADSKALSLAVKSIRETIKTVEARGVNLRLYKNELLPYRIPSGIAGIAMKMLFASNELTSRIMTLHSDVNDILYGCKCVYDEGKKHGLELPLFYKNMERIMASL